MKRIQSVACFRAEALDQRPATLDEVPECESVFARPGRACMSRRIPMPWLEAVRTRDLTEDQALA